MCNRGKRMSRSRFLKASQPARLIVLGFSCNNNCVVCSFGKNRGDHTTKMIQSLLRAGRKDMFESVELTGGETIIRTDFIKLIAYSKKIGYKDIAVSTNGRLFCYKDYLKSAVKNGLNCIAFTLYGPNQKLHDAITRSPGSFSQTVKGIKNALGHHPNVNTSVNTVVCRFNYRHINKTANFLRNLGVKTWRIIDLIPIGHAKTFYKSLEVSLNEKSSLIQKVGKTIKSFSLIQFYDFPVCLSTPRLRGQKNLHFVTAQKITTAIRQVGYNPTRITNSPENFYFDTFKTRIHICQRCVFKKNCGGIWKASLNSNNISKIETFAANNQCLSNTTQ